MRHFGSVVRVAVRAVGYRWHHQPVRGRITPQLIGDQTAGETALSLQQLPEEPNGGAPIPSRLDQDIEDVAVFVYGSPQVLLAAVECDEQLIEMPRISEAPASLPKSSSIRTAERSTPPSDRLIGDRDASLGQEVLNIPKTEAEAKVEPDSVRDDVGRESIAVVAGRRTDHPATLLLSTST